MNRPEFFFFDLGNVLINFDHERAAAQIANISGLDISVIRQIVFDSELQSEYEIGQIDTAQFYESFCRETKSDVSQSELMHAASDIFLGQSVHCSADYDAARRTVSVGNCFQYVSGSLGIHYRPARQHHPHV